MADGWPFDPTATRGAIPIDVVAARARLAPSRPGMVGGGVAMPGGAPSTFPGQGGGSLLRPDFFPPLAAVDLQVFGQSSLIGPNAQPVPLAGGTFNLPSSNVGFLRSLTLTVGPSTVVTDVRYFLYVNGAPAPGWGDLRIAAATAAVVSKNFGPDETRIVIPAGALIEFRAQILDANNYLVSMDAHGWSMPESVWLAATQGAS